MIVKNKSCFGKMAAVFAIVILFLLTYKSKVFEVDGYLIEAMGLMSAVLIFNLLRLLYLNELLSRYVLDQDLLLLFMVLMLVLLSGVFNEISANIGVSSLGVFISNLLPFVMFVAMFMGSNCRRPDYVEDVFSILQLFAFLTLVLAIVMYVHRQPFHVFGFLFGMASGYARMHGHMGNPNDFAKLMGVSALYSIVWVVFSQNRKKRSLHLLMFLFFVFGLISSVSLSAYLSFILTVVLFWLMLFLLGNGQSTDRLGFILLLMVFFIVIGGMVAIASGFEGVLLDPQVGILERFNSVGDGDLSGRWHIWETIWGVASSSEWWRIFVGYGNGWLSNRGLVAHNSFINALFSYGAVFFLVFVVLDYLLFKKLILIFKQTREIWSMQMLVLLIYGHIESLAGNEIFSGLTIIGLFFCFVVAVTMTRERTGCVWN